MPSAIHLFCAHIASSLLLGAPSQTRDVDADSADAATLIQRVIESQPAQHRAQRAFTFRERTVTRKLAKDGAVNGTASVSFLVTPSVDGEYRRLIAKDGKPLTPRDEAKESRKLEKHMKEQLRLSPEEREQQARDKLDKRVERYQKRLEEALEVFEFEAQPDEILEGHAVRVFRFTRRAGYEGHSRPTKLFARMEGTVWIDARRDQLAKVSVEFTEDLAFLGGVFGRVSKGTRAVVVGTLRDNVWLLDDVDVELNARLYFFKRYRQQISVDYEDYQRFDVETTEEVATSGTGAER